MLAPLGLALALSGAAAPAAAWRLSAEPANTGEAALKDASTREGAAAIEGLRAAARQFPDSEISGLAHLGAGLRLLDQGRYTEALVELAHPDLQRTAFADLALEATGRAQEPLGQSQAAARSFVAAAAAPASAVVCSALPRAAALFLTAGQAGDAVSALERVVADCPRSTASALFDLGQAELARGDRGAAALAWDRLDRELPASPPALQAHRRLASLADQLPARAPAEQARIALARGTSLLDAGRTGEAIEALRALPLALLAPADADLARVSLASALAAKARTREAIALLDKIPADSTVAAQAAFLRAREQARRSRTPEAFVAVADRFRGSPWAEEALLALANHYQRDALDEQALPFWRRLASEYPQGRYADRATWRTAWADQRAGRFESAAQVLETTARLRPPSVATAGFLYWAGRARQSLGQSERARQLLQETVRRYKYSYHGLRAREALARLGPGAEPQPALSSDGEPQEPPLPEPRATRLRELLLLERLDEAAQELGLLPESSRVGATLAWIEWRQGRLRPAITTMKRAFPEWISEGGDRLPAEVWRILFPLRYEEKLRAAADGESLDPALVAALILQESTFDAAALSRAGARGLMQVMPATGRRIARSKGQRYRRAALQDPGTSLDFGTHYLRQMSDRFAGSVEKVLAAYNAGPHRVDAWTVERGERSAEEFIETIPFTETRQYVMIVLASREHYRRIYGLGKAVPAPVNEGARP